jgi:hypothetical protein
MAKPFKPGKSNLKGIIAGILLVIGFLICVFANQWAVKQHLVGAVWNTWPDRIYDRVFFSRDGSLVGAKADGSRLIVERERYGEMDNRPRAERQFLRLPDRLGDGSRSPAPRLRED